MESERKRKKEKENWYRSAKTIIEFSLLYIQIGLLSILRSKDKVDTKFNKS